MRWYLTVAAVLEYQTIAGYPRQRDGEWFDRAERELAELADKAELKKAAWEAGEAAIYQVKAEVRGKLSRIELYVAESPRPEGPLSQLVRVRLKSGGSRRAAQRRK